MFGNWQRKAEKLFETDVNRVVTPMLDMTFQLLFYFVINFRPAITEGQIDLNLPPESPRQRDDLALETDDKPDEYRITAYSSAGPIELLTFKMKDFEPDSMPIDNMLGELKKRLQSIPKPAAGSKAMPPVIKIECAQKLRYSELMQIMNLCREQGFMDIGILPIPKDKKGGAAAMQQ